MSYLYGAKVNISYTKSIDEFSAECGSTNAKITQQYAVQGHYKLYNGLNLLRHALHNTVPDMMKSIGKDEHGNDIKVRDSEGIQLANAKIDEIRSGFTDWLEAQSPEFKVSFAGKDTQLLASSPCKLFLEKTEAYNAQVKAAIEQAGQKKA